MIGGDKIDLVKSGLVQKLSLPVEGMTCASCVARVEKSISKLEGVKNVSVNFATEKVNFELDPQKISVNDVAASVEDAGYKLIVQNNKVEAVKASGSSEEQVHVKDEFYEKLKKDFFIALAFTIPVFIISMSMEFSWFHKLVPLSMDEVNKILLILATPVVFISGARFYSIFYRNLKHFSADMNSLVAIGTGAAFGYSVISTLFPEWLSSSHVYFDSTAVIITLILLGRLLEHRAKKKTGGAIQKLLELKPKTALVKKDGIEVETKIEDLAIGDTVIVRPGEKIPADGIVTSGRSAVDEAMLTGESIPVEKTIGAKIIGGSLNKNGYMEFRITALGDNSVLGRIIRMVEDAQGSKAPIQNLADKVAAVFVPVVVGVAVLTFVLWLILGGENAFNSALINFVAILIIACPCALGLATPTAIVVGTGLGAGKGILIKNGESLELAHKINAVVFDKTGTITEGEPHVSDILPFDIERNELVKLAASVENKSEHPLAAAIVDYAKKEKIGLMEVGAFDSIPGKGIIADINGSKIIAGNSKIMNENGIDLGQYENEIAGLNKDGKITIYFAIRGKLKGIIGIEDPIRETSAEAIRLLKEMNIEAVMISGDNKKTAAAIAERVGIDKFIAEALPEDKAAEISKLQKEGKLVAMVGDGVNDAPALALSDVGIAIGAGTDAAIEASQITLVKGDLMGVVNSIKLSRQTIKTIKQNLFWAFIYNTAGIPLAAFGLLNPMFAALAMSFSSVSVVTNSLRLKNYKLQ
jgi:Cu+-exporting ATPase